MNCTSLHFLLAVGVSFLLSSCAAVQKPVYHAVNGLNYCLQSTDIKQATIDGQSIEYFDSPPKDPAHARTTPIVLIHGLTADKECWQLMMGTLRERHRLIGLDLAGHGKSADAEDGDYSFASQAQRIHLLLEQLKIDQAHLLGHSMGGGIAMKFAALYPEKTASIGIIDAAGAPDQETEELLARIAACSNPLIVSDDWSASKKLRYMTNGPTWMHIVYDFCFSRYINVRDRKKQDLFKTIYATVSRETLSKAELASIDQPAFILWGTGDRVIKPAMADYYRDHLGGTSPELVTVDGGHAPIADQHSGTADAYVKFLRRVEAELKP